MHLNGTAGFIDPERLRARPRTPATASRTCCSSGPPCNTTELTTNKSVQQRWHDLEFYIADSYKVSPRVTADFGVRFSHMQPPYMKDDAMGNFVLGLGQPGARATRPATACSTPRGRTPAPRSDWPAAATVRTVARAHEVPVGRPARRRGLGRLRQRQDGRCAPASAASTSATGSARGWASARTRRSRAARRSSAPSTPRPW